VVEGATFLLMCHDDVVLDPSVARILVEEGYRSNAGILGPKLVSAENPNVLLEVVARSTASARPYTGIEPGGVDQEQHDGAARRLLRPDRGDARAHRPVPSSRASTRDIPVPKL